MDKLILLVGAVLLALHALAPALRGAASDMTRERELGAALNADALAKLGIVYNPGIKYRFKRIYDTQAIALALGSTTSFFQTATSDMVNNAFKRAGCNLAVKGEIDKSTDFRLLGLYVKPVKHRPLAAAIDTDLGKFQEFGWIEKILVSRQTYHDGPIPVASCAINEQALLVYDGMPSAALAGPQGTFRGPEGARGYLLSPFEQTTIEGGEQIQVDVTHYGEAALSANITVQVGLLGVEMTLKSSDV